MLAIDLIGQILGFEYAVLEYFIDTIIITSLKISVCFAFKK